MYCRICGDERDVQFYPDKGMQALCRSCASDTPRKVGFDEFFKAYWPGATIESVGRAIAREFYSDYIASSHNLKEYIKATTFDTL